MREVNIGILIGVISGVAVILAMAGVSTATVLSLSILGLTLTVLFASITLCEIVDILKELKKR